MFIGAGDFSACITSRGELLIWGLPNLKRDPSPYHDNSKQRVVVKYEMKDKISSMSIRAKNAVLLDDKGKVWRLGLDYFTKGNIDMGRNRDSIPSLDRDSRILQVSSVEGRQVKSISAGKGFTVAICKGKAEVKVYSPLPSNSIYNLSGRKNTVNLAPKSFQQTQEFNTKDTNKKRTILIKDEEVEATRAGDFTVPITITGDKTPYEYSVSRKGEEFFGRSKLTQKSSRGSNDSFKVSRREVHNNRSKSPNRDNYLTPNLNNIQEIRLIKGKKNIRTLSRSGSSKKNFDYNSNQVTSSVKKETFQSSRHYQSIGNFSHSSKKYEIGNSVESGKREIKGTGRTKGRSRTKKILKKEIARLLGQINEQDKLLDDTFSKNRELKNENEELRSEIVSLRRQMREENIFANRKVKDGMNEIQNLEEKYKSKNIAYQRQIETLNEDYDVISQKLMEYMKILSHKTQENKILKNELDEVKIQNDENEKKNQEIHDLEQNNRNLLTKKNTLNIENLKLKEQVHHLERKISDKNQDIDEALNKKISAQEEALNAKKQLNFKEKEIVTLSHKLQASNSEIEELISKNKELSRLLDESIYQKSINASKKFVKYNSDASILSSTNFLHKTVQDVSSNMRSSKHSSKENPQLLKTYHYEPQTKNIVISDKYTPTEYRLTRKSNFMSPNTPKSPTPINSPSQPLPFKSPTPVNSPPENDAENKNISSILRSGSSYKYIGNNYSKERHFALRSSNGKKRVSYSPDVDVHNFNQSSPPLSRRQRNMSYDESVRKKSLEFAKGAQNLLGIFDGYGVRGRDSLHDDVIDSGIRKVVGRRVKLEEKIREFEQHVLKN